jgi:hypothetical protein
MAQHPFVSSSVLSQAMRPMSSAYEQALNGAASSSSPSPSQQSADTRMRSQRWATFGCNKQSTDQLFGPSFGPSSFFTQPERARSAQELPNLRQEAMIRADAAKSAARPHPPDPLMGSKTSWTECRTG